MKLRDWFDREPPTPDIPTRPIPAHELREGMTMVAMPEDWAKVWPHEDGRWPTVTDVRHMDNGEDGRPCVYWDVDLPEQCKPGKPTVRCRRHFWAFRDLSITIGAA